MKKSMWAWLESASYTALMWAKTKEQKRIQSSNVNPMQQKYQDKTWQEVLQDGSEYVENITRHANTPDYGLLTNPDEVKDKEVYTQWLSQMYTKAIKANEIQEFALQYREFCDIHQNETITTLNQTFIKGLYFDPNPTPRLIWSKTVQTPEDFLHTQAQICQRSMDLNEYDLSAWDWSHPSLKSAIILQIIKLYPIYIDKEALQDLCTKYNVTKDDIHLFYPSLRVSSHQVSSQQAYDVAQILAGKDAIWYGINMREDSFVSIFEKDPLFTLAKAWRGIVFTEEEQKLNPIAFSLYNERHAPTLRELADPLPPTWALANELSGNDPIAFCRFIERSYNTQHKTSQLDLDFNGVNDESTTVDTINSNLLGH